MYEWFKGSWIVTYQPYYTLINIHSELTSGHTVLKVAFMKFTEQLIRYRWPSHISLIFLMVIVELTTPQLYY